MSWSFTTQGRNIVSFTRLFIGRAAHACSLDLKGLAVEAMCPRVINAFPLLKVLLEQIGTNEMVRK